MPWTKSEATLGDGVQLLTGRRAPRMQPQVVPSYTFTCPCGGSTTVLAVNPKAPVRAWCCGSYHELPAEQMPKQSLLTRLLQS
jgi:hypothetical protein